MSRILYSNKGYGIIETSVVVVVMGILILVFMDRYEKTVYETQKTALKAELLNLRQSIKLFKIIKGRYPGSLKELVSERYSYPYQKGTPYVKDLMSDAYLEPYSVDKDKNILDPFDQPYIYNSITGEVRTPHKGFEGY